MKEYKLGKMGGHGLVLMEDLGIQPFGLRNRHIGVFRCYCGRTFTTRINSINLGRTKSCGCRRPPRAHPYVDTNIYNNWSNMRNRCNNPNNRSYEYYGGRGISVCSEWDDFLVFREYVISLDGYDHCDEYGLSLDRYDNDGNYEPGNLRWATQGQQMNNRRPSKMSVLNTSGYIGVVRRSGAWNGGGYDVLWSSIVTIDKKRVCLGSFDSARKAALRRESEILTRGLNLRLNF